MTGTSLESWFENFKIKEVHLLRYENQLVTTSAILINNVQSCLTSSSTVQPRSQAPPHLGTRLQLEKLEKQDKFHQRGKSYCRTAEGWFRCKHCKSKSGFFFSMLAKFCYYISQYLFGNLLELFLLARICFVRSMLFSVGACLIFIASTNTSSVFSDDM